VAAAASANESHHGDDDATVDSTNDATNTNTQSATAETNQLALTNSGFNSSGADVHGWNGTWQEAYADAFGGNIGDGGYGPLSDGYGATRATPRRPRVPVRRQRRTRPT
jgi:hypothetical protein